MYCDKKLKNKIEIADIEGVNSHFLCNKQIYYVVSIKDKNGFLWLRMEDCFSYHISYS